MSLNLLEKFSDILGEKSEEICDSQPLSLSPIDLNNIVDRTANVDITAKPIRPARGTGQRAEFRSNEEIETKYRHVFTYPFFNLVQSRVIDDALYTDKSMVVCAPTGSGKTVVFEMAIVQLLMELEDKNECNDFKIIYIAPVKALCTERLTEWYPKFTPLGLLCIEVTGDTDVDFSQLQPYRIIITTPEKWDMLTRRWRDHRKLVEEIKLFLIDEVHILNDCARGPVLEAVVSRMKTIESSVQSAHRIEQLQQQYLSAGTGTGTDTGTCTSTGTSTGTSAKIRFVAVSATVGNPGDVAAWLGAEGRPAVHYQFGDECRPVKVKRVVEGYHCAVGSSIFKFDIILNYKLWPIIQKYHNGKPTLIFCNTRKSVQLTAETLSKEITINFNEEQKARLNALASTIKTKKLQALVLSGIGCHHAGLLFEERMNIEQAFRNRDLPILATTTTLAMGVNLPAHLVIIKNTQQYVNGAYQEYSISTVLQMVGRAGRPQFDTEATAVIMTRSTDKFRYQTLLGGSEPLQSYLHKRLPENLNSEAALGTVGDVAQCVQWLRSTFLSVRAAKDPKRYLGLPPTAPPNQISQKIEELCVKAMNSLASSGLITMDEACCIESTEAGRLMSIYYLDLETMKHIMKIDGTESLERLLWLVCESHELADRHLRVDERRSLNALNRSTTNSTIRYPMKGKITTRQMKLNCIIQASLGCLPIPDPSLNQEAGKVMRIADRVCKCLVAYVTRPALISQQPKYFSAVLNSIVLAKCVFASLWENSPFVSKQLRGIGPTYSTLLATAGKTNFMILEESHPRDLERIMNKGPPAGNTIRKQISLFPKYQITATPVDEKVVSIELKLLNHHNLAENMENLTAGAMHKSHIVIGDSENTLLLFTSFKDSDLIGIYDGNITFQVTRKFRFEHKIYVHCISSNIVGLDVSCEYVFNDIENPIRQEIYAEKNSTPKQSTITESFRQRKRKNTDCEISQSKEKKKRESALFEKLKNLKESFGKTSKVLKEDLEKSSNMSKQILQNLNPLKKSVEPNINRSNENDDNNKAVIINEEPEPYIISDNDFDDDDEITNILNEIETEIVSKEGDKTKRIDNTIQIPNLSSMQGHLNNRQCVSSNYFYSDSNIIKPNNNKRVKNIKKKSNFEFIDIIENKENCIDENTKEIEQNSFSDAIKSHIEKFILKTKSNVKSPNIKDIILDEPLPHVSEENVPIVTVENSLFEQDGYSDTLIQYGSKENLCNERQEITIQMPTINSHTLDSNDDQHYKLIEGSNDDSTEHHRVQKRHNEHDTKILEDYSNVSELNTSIDIKQPESLSNICKNLIGDSFPLSSIENICNNYTNKINSNIAFQTARVSPSSLGENLVNNSAKLSETNESSVISSEPQTKVNEIVPVANNSKIKEVQELPRLELWKKYIKELPLELEANDLRRSMKSLTNNSPDIGYTSNPIKVNPDLLNVLKSPKVSEIVKLTTAETKKSKQSFVPPYKQFNTASQENVANPTHLTYSTSMDIKEPVSSEIRDENSGIRDEKKCQTKTIYENITIPSHSTSYSSIVIKEPISSGIREILSNTDDYTVNRSITPSTNNSPGVDVTRFNIASLTGIKQDSMKLSHGSSTTVSHLKKTMDLGNAPNFEIVNYHKNEHLLDTTSDVGKLITSQNQNYEHITKNRSQKHYINKYSYSSNQIGVSSRETTDHVVRVIRKLRIDLDVTEIISKTDKTNTQKYEENHKESAHGGEDRAIQNSAVLDYVQEGQNKEDIKEIDEVREISKTQDKCFHKESFVGTDMSNDINETENIQKQNKPNSINDILLKYEKMMRQKKTARTDDFRPEVKKYSPLPPKHHKSNRPFRITELHRINTSPLPEVLIEKPILSSLQDVQNPKMLGNRKDLYKQSYSDKNIVLDIKNESITSHKDEETKKETESVNLCNEIIPSNMTQHTEDKTYEEYIGLDETDPDSDIDQTLLDPQKLLQCFNNDVSDVCIPPPPEFSDDYNKLDSNNLTLSRDCFEPMECDELPQEENHSKSIFQESQAELTPSKEIETWNLSEDDGQTLFTPSTSPYSFTTMHNKEHSVEIPSSEYRHWNLSNAHHKKYSLKNDSYSFMSLQNTNNYAAKRAVEQSNAQVRNSKMKQFKFLHRKKYM